ncbi:hypothetical protein K3495_g15029 [Podosphaera aphanis]|nr:hypothetical protein K3495_g15029 [Podosphaera aphanis]
MALKKQSEDEVAVEDEEEEVEINNHLTIEPVLFRIELNMIQYVTGGRKAFGKRNRQGRLVRRYVG